MRKYKEADLKLILPEDSWNGVTQKRMTQTQTRTEIINESNMMVMMVMMVIQN